MAICLTLCLCFYFPWCRCFVVVSVWVVVLWWRGSFGVFWGGAGASSKMREFGFICFV